MYQKRTQPEVEAILVFYQQKHTQKETCAKFTITKNQLQYLVKRNGVKNGRTLSEINREKALLGAEKTLKRCENNLANKLLNHGFGYIDGYEKKGSLVRVACLDCGTIFARRSDYFDKYGYKCPACEKAKQQAERAEKERRKKQEQEEQREAREKERARKNSQHENRLTELHTCKVCGGSYSIRDYMTSTGTRYERDSGFCSKECRKAYKKIRDKNWKMLTGWSDNHRARARRYGCEYDPSVKLIKLVERDGLTCALCGGLCDWNDHSWSAWAGPLYPSIDHIIPMAKKGGHTWDNVQVAHIQCNSEKGASIMDLITEDGSHGNEEDNNKKENQTDTEVG